MKSRIDPCFVQRQDILAKAARCICYIGTKQDDEYATGTAFFVSPTILLTAEHVVPDKSVSVLAQLPGVQQAEFNVERLFKKDSLEIETFICHPVSDKKNYFVDITILDCSQSSYRATDWLELDQVVLSHGTKVDVIGYPGEYTIRYLEDSQGVRIGGSELVDITELLPRWKLTVTHGPVIRGGKLPTYRLSTIGGMSGSPVILNGKAVGIPTSRRLLLTLGVHVGCNKAQSNRCIAFTNESAWKFLKDHDIVGTNYFIYLLTEAATDEESDDESKSKVSNLVRNYRRGVSTPPQQPY